MSPGSTTLFFRAVHALASTSVFLHVSSCSGLDVLSISYFSCIGVDDRVCFYYAFSSSTVGFLCSLLFLSCPGVDSLCFFYTLSCSGVDYLCYLCYSMLWRRFSMLFLCFCYIYIYTYIHICSYVVSTDRVRFIQDREPGSICSGS